MKSAMLDMYTQDAELVSKGGYKAILTATVNQKGVLDVDTIKGCELGMRAYPGRGCYGECYAAKTAHTYGKDFTKSVPRKLIGPRHRARIMRTIMKYRAGWYRVGTFGDPCHDWDHTISVLNELKWTKKIPVIITKHWRTLSDEHVEQLRDLKAVVNTSVSGLDTNAELKHRVRQIKRLRDAGVRSVARVVTCQYGTSEWARECKYKQDFLLTLSPVIDNPLRVSPSNPRLINGDILATRRKDSVGGGTLVSLHDESVFLGACVSCKDQCGADGA